MKSIYNCCFIMFIVFTFGLISVNVKYSDGTEFNYKGIIERISEAEK